MEVTGPDANGHSGSNVVARSIVGLIAGAILGAVLGAIFGVVVYLIFGWLLSGVTTFLGLNILQTLAGLYVGSIIGTLVGAIIGLIFVGSVNIAEESPFYSVFGALFAWLTYTQFGVFSSGVESAVTGASIGVIAGLITGFASGLLNKGSLDKVFRVSSARNIDNRHNAWYRHRPAHRLRSRVRDNCDLTEEIFTRRLIPDLLFLLEFIVKRVQRLSQLMSKRRTCFDLKLCQDGQ
jgi:ABC-type multidrug transport system fused ATPase/permease subunit